jgi:CheY-like chemotaxis protein
MSRIILVEDSVYDRFMIRECVEEAGLQAEIVEISRGDEAEQFFRQAVNHSFDLVLLDVNLPRRNGYEVLQAIREQNNTRSKPVVMMSISKMKPEAVKDAAYQPDLFWLKPNSPEEFCKIAKIIRDYLKQTPDYE